MNSSLSQSTQSTDSVASKSRQPDWKKPDRENKDTDVAVIGMACRFPGAGDYRQFWRNLVSGVDSVTEIPADRWDWRDYYGDPTTEANKTNSNWGGFIEDVDKFDAAFFNISPREAELMDPQQRILLELSISCIEDAGYKPSDLGGSDTGIFIGICNYDYKELQERYGRQIEGHLLTGTANTIVPNRLSYHLNVHGPSLSVDTACSSSLVALHQAVQAMSKGECQLCLVGGINILVSPERFIPFSKLNMLSPTGRCRTFDSGADGYVRGEGAGIVLLKRLTQAVDDGDQICGIIKGTAVNHGGQARTLISPNAFAQSKVIADACTHAEISPATVNYIETHGTGTPLGDPIEINGLKRSFGKLFKAMEQEPQAGFCGLGSVKTNIGHLEAAAGIAGLIKVLLSLKHKKLPGINHLSQLNPRIKLADSPFYIVEQTKDWDAVTDKTGNVLPRRAGVSSFGFGGTNAHVVLEEYQELETRDANQESGEEPRLIVLSARNEERLNAHAARLSTYLEQAPYPAEQGLDGGERPSAIEQTLPEMAAEGKNKTQGFPRPTLSLASIAYTLQAGRTAMDSRLAFVASNIADVRHKLTGYLEGDTKNIYQGHVKANENRLTLLTEGEEGQAFIQALIRRGKLIKLAQLWVSGVEIDWSMLYGVKKPDRLSLPAYPFARQRFWLPEAGDGKPAQAVRYKTGLPPLLDSNESTFTAQVFKKILRRDELILRDHRVKGHIILPGTAHLEMARAAVERATQRPVRGLRDVMWGRPIILEGGQKEIFIEVWPETEAIGYSIYRQAGDQRINFSQGKVICDRDVSLDNVADQPQIFDLEAIKKRCITRKTKEDIYKIFCQLGFDYGPGFQVTEELCGNDQEGLSCLKIEKTVENNFTGYGLYPPLMDGALRALFGIGLTEESTGERQLQIPFGLERLEIFHPLEESCYAYARRRTGGTQTEIVDISVLNENGKELVRITGYTGRPFVSEESVEKKSDELLYYRPVWTEKELTQSDDVSSSGDGDPKNIILFDSNEKIFQKLQSGGRDNIVRVSPGQAYQNLDRGKYWVNMTRAEDYHQLFKDLIDGDFVPTHIIHLWSSENDNSDRLEHRLGRGLYSILYITQAVTTLLPEHAVKCLYGCISETGGIPPENEMISGLSKSLTAINHRFQLVSLQIWDKTDDSDITLIIKKELDADSRNGTEIGYKHFKRFERTIVALETEKEKTESSIEIKQNDVIIITGGAGGLGLLFAKYLSETYQAKLILLGRSKSGGEKAKTIAGLQQHGADLLYVQADVSNIDDVRAAIKQGKDKYGSIDGIIHAAGVEEKIELMAADQKSFEKTLRAKVQGTINLDVATQAEPLRYFILFSSIAAQMGDFGVGSYAAGNRYMDSYGLFREKLRQNRQRSGETLSINWPYWAIGGMGKDNFGQNEDVKRMYFGYSGLKPLNEADGIKAFEELRKTGPGQTIVAAGTGEKIDRVLRVQPDVGRERFKASKKEDVIDKADAAEGDLSAGTETYLKQKLSAVIKLSPNEIESNALFGSYGVDSILMMEMNKRLSQDFSSLPATLFFEYETIHQLAGYFVKHHEQTLASLLDFKPTAAASQKTKQAVSENDRKLEHKRMISAPEFRFSQVKNKQEAHSEDVAVIGLSGRYPQASNLEEFWQKLKQGQDCITEVPAERWDYQEYYDADKQKAGKTYSKWGGFMADVDKFDSLFFNISPREAELMDPQERLFLEIAWQTLEDAGYTRQALAQQLEGRVGVFVGVMWSEYLLHGIVKSPPVTPTAFYGSVANRVSYVLNLRGPSMAVDTMCSSSLTTIHLACESIRRGECAAALAGGVNISIHPNKYLYLSQREFVSSDGRCRSFGQGGDGYVPGEGVGAVLLKPLAQAKADGDRIYGIIKSSSVNHSGKTHGYTVPSPVAQARLIAENLRKSSVSPSSISYVEAHGTGTALGDPIEIRGLSQAFGDGRPAGQVCAIGSVKSNIGHLESAAGIAGLTKVLLQMKHRQLVPSLHSERLNPYIDFAATPFKVTQSLAEWKRPVIEVDGVQREFPRRAGISSFGAGGSNAHLVVEEYDSQVSGIKPVLSAVEGSQVSGLHLIVLSAQDEERLRIYANNILAFLREGAFLQKDRFLENGISLDDIAYTLQAGREAMKSRIAFVVENKAELSHKLTDFIAGKAEIKGCYQGQMKQEDRPDIFADDEDIREIVNKWIVKRKLGKLAQLWVTGADINWSLLYGKERPMRISLPTYPFAKKRYWFDRHAEKKTKMPQATPADRQKTRGALSSVSRRQREKSDYEGLSNTSLEAGRHKIVLAELNDFSVPSKNVLDPDSREKRDLSLALNPSISHLAEDIIELEDESATSAATEKDINSKRMEARIDRAAILQKLKAQLAEILYIEIDELDDGDKFIDLGLDSVTGVEWLRRIIDEFGINIAVADIYNYPTLRDLTQYIKGMLGQHPAEKEAAEIELKIKKEAPTNFSAEPVAYDLDNQARITLKQLSSEAETQIKPGDYRSGVSTVQSIEDTGVLSRPPSVAKGDTATDQPLLSPASSDDDLLVAIQPEGTNLPFFCVTAGYGDVPALAALAAKIGSDQPFYTLRPPLNGRQLPNTQMLAARYVQTLRKIQPQGPYLLGGYCSGGLMAFEMAQQLWTQGEQVELLALLDTPYTISHFFHTNFQFLQRSLAKFLPDIRRNQYRIMQLGAALFKDAGLDTHLRTLRGYIPQPYPGRITLFLATWSYYRLPPTRRRWRKIAGQGLEIRRIPGDHDSFVRGHHVTVLAKKLRIELDKARDLE
ncbi:MAG: SDR family NAD(P)-dependent oxidoreductase [Gammaproteobacteria bacterium]|nr:SDR family NAD(P)-dependent oxidoreductase [Gammaproteobacteria bacterium]